MNSLVTSTKRNIIFWIVLFCIPIIVLAMLELGLSIFDYGDDLTLFKQAKGEYSDYMYINRWVGKRFFSSQGIPDPTNDVFLKQKPENGYRIFVIGGSTAAGWPYPNNIMFSRILNRILTDTFPDKYIEVVNTSISAVNSYAFREFTDDILQHEPDLILIYAGHNEYYGVLGVGSSQKLGDSVWITNTFLQFNRLKIFQLLKNIIRNISSWWVDDTENDNEESSTLMERMVNDQQIEYGSALYKKGIEQFKSNISELIAEYKKAGVEVIISELVSNVSDQPPFKSINKSAQPADMIYGNAADLEREEKYLQAKEQYYRAKDLDALRFRASEDFNKLINQFSEQFDIQVVAMKNRFEESSPNGLIGNNLMLDHLHPNIDGHFIMAEAFCKSILDNELIMAVPDTAFIRDISDYRKNWGYSVLDSVYANMRIEYLKSSWPFTSQRNRPENQNFIPKNRIEEIAMRIWQDRSYTSEDGHADLAQMFESRNMFENAFHEYNALSCLKPLNITAYLKAADVSIKAGNLQRALPFLKYSLKIEKSAFANKWIGIINLDQGDFANAIKNLEIVYNLDIKDPETIYNLALAYYKVGQPDLINKILLDLKKLEKDDSEVKSMILTLEHLIKQSGVQ